MNFFSDKRLIFRKLKGFGQLFLVAGPVKTPTFYTGREKIKQDLLKFGGIDGPAVCRKADMETENQRTVFGSADFTCVRARISCPQLLTESRPLFPDPFAWKLNFRIWEANRLRR